jgi:hypothetical protein
VIAALQAAEIDGKEHIPAAVASVIGRSLRVSSVMMPSVPSGPYDQGCQIVPGGRLACAAASVDNFTIMQDAF